MRSPFFRLTTWLPSRQNATSTLAKLAVLCGASWSYETAATVLNRLTGASLCAKTIQLLVQKAAEPARAEDAEDYETAKRKAARDALERLRPSSCVGDGSSVTQSALSKPASLPRKRIYLGFDGVFVPSRTSPTGMEGKVATVFTDDPEDRVQISRKRTLLLWKERAASFGTYHTIAKKVYSIVWNQELTNEELTVLGDGAPWIPALRDTYFPTARYLLDWWHLKEYVHRSLREILPEPGDQVPRQRVRRALVARLWRGNREAALNELSKVVPSTSDAEQQLHRLSHYLTQNAEGIVDYHAYQKLGRTISSSVVEKTGDLLIARRCKHQGMVWSREGADAIALMRTLIASGRWEEHWRCRTVA